MSERSSHSQLSALLETHGRSLTLLAVTLGFVLRLAFSFGYWVGKPLSHDEEEYLELAHNVAAGQGLRYDAPQLDPLTEERFSRPPLYPLFVAAVARGPLLAGTRDATLRRVKIAQAALGALGVWLVARLALCAGPAASAIAGLLAAGYPPLVWITAYVLSETLYSTLALASALMLGSVGRAGEGQGQSRALGVALAGLLAGAAALARSVGLFFIAFAVAWLAARRSVGWTLAFAAGAGLVVAPWSVRTSVEHGRPMIVAAEGGVNFWVGNHPLARGDGDLAANPRIKDANREFRSRHPGLSPEALEPFYYREAFGHIAERPAWWLGLLVRKFFYTWVPIGPSYTLHSRRYYLASLASYVPVLAFGLAGAAQWLRRRAAPPVLLLLAGSALSAELVFFPQERYRIPVVDPTLLVFTASWLASRVATVGLPSPEVSSDHG